MIHFIFWTHINLNFIVRCCFPKPFRHYLGQILPSPVSLRIAGKVLYVPKIFVYHLVYARQIFASAESLVAVWYLSDVTGTVLCKVHSKLQFDDAVHVKCLEYKMGSSTEKLLF